MGTALFERDKALRPAAITAEAQGATADLSGRQTLRLNLSREQHLQVLGATSWHRTGCTGRGIRVAILDTGFRGYRAHLGHDLPESVECHSFRLDGNLEARDSQHGILCGEVVHAVAPAAQLLFANWEPDRPDCFLAAVRWARANGAKLISCSVIMPSWSDGDGHGSFNDQLARLLGQGNDPSDPLFLACAGNTALRHWYGSYRAGPGGYHEWASGIIANPVIPWGIDRVSIELYGHGPATYELSVLDDQCKTVGFARSEGDGQRVWCTVRFTPRPGATYRVKMRPRLGNPGCFHLVALGASLGEFVTRGSVCCPADDPHVIAVGAVDAIGQRQPYSSCGQNSRQPKPDLVAPVPFASAWRSIPFSGTSAAAPQVAGLAALYWSLHPKVPADQVREVLYASAQPLNSPSSSVLTGFGQVYLRPPNPASVVIVIPAFSAFRQSH